MKYSPTDSLTKLFASSFGSGLDEIDRIWTTAMLGICHFEAGGQTQGASCLLTAVNAVEEINENLDPTGDYPEGKPQLNRGSNTWIASNSHTAEGLFFTAMSQRRELYLFKCWEQAQTGASLLKEVD